MPVDGPRVKVGGLADDVAGGPGGLARLLLTLDGEGDTDSEDGAAEDVGTNGGVDEDAVLDGLADRDIDVVCTVDADAGAAG